MTDADFIDSLKSGRVDLFNDTQKLIRAAELIHNHCMKAITLTKEQYEILVNWLQQYQVMSSSPFASMPPSYRSNEPYKWFLSAHYTSSRFDPTKPTIVAKSSLGRFGGLQRLRGLQGMAGGLMRGMQFKLSENHKENLSKFLGFCGQLMLLLLVLAKNLFMICLRGLLYLVCRSAQPARQVQPIRQAEQPDYEAKHDIDEDEFADHGERRLEAQQDDWQEDDMQIIAELHAEQPLLTLHDMLHGLNFPQD